MEQVFNENLSGRKTDDILGCFPSISPYQPGFLKNPSRHLISYAIKIIKKRRIDKKNFIQFFYLTSPSCTIIMVINLMTIKLITIKNRGPYASFLRQKKRNRSSFAN